MNCLGYSNGHWLADYYTLTLWDERAGRPIVRYLKPWPNSKTQWRSQVIILHLLQLLPRSSRFDLDKIYVYLVRNMWNLRTSFSLEKKNGYRPPTRPTASTDWWPRQHSARFEILKLRFIRSGPNPGCVFWNPDCTFAKELPALARLYPEYKALGLKSCRSFVVNEGLVESCWKGDEDVAAMAWYYWADPNGASMFQVIYNVYTIPAMYLLDDNRHIICRGQGDLYDELEWLLKKHIKSKN